MGYDAVVVGAGPGGAMSAYNLSKKGLRVLIIEKRKLPRFKLCGGCISARIGSYLPEGWRYKVLNTIRGGILGFRGEEFVKGESEGEVAYIVDRADFDHFLTEKALQAGAHLWEGIEFRGFEEGNKIRVKTSKGTAECDFLIGADGFFSKVARQMGFNKERYYRGIEFWCDRSEVHEDISERVIIDIGILSRGYGWVFPKGNQASIGLATAGPENPLNKLKEYVSLHRLLKGADLRGAKSWFIPYAESHSDLHPGRGRVILVGDSAGMVDPLIGEGIYWSVYGAHLLTEAILKDNDNPARIYSELIRREMADELISAGKIASLAYRFQRASFRMGKGKALERFLHLLRGETSYRKLYTSGIPEFITSLLHFENFLHIIIDKILRRR